MKTKLISFLVAAVSASAFSQGLGKVGFVNDANHLFVLGATLPADAGIAEIPVSPLPSGLTLQALLYAGITAESLSLKSTVVLDANGWKAPGLMLPKSVSMPGIPAHVADYFKVFVTDTGATSPATIDGNTVTRDAFAATYYGASGTFTAVPDGMVYPAIVPGGAAQSTWQSGSLRIDAIPEPSSLAIAGIGIVLLLRQRLTRKQPCSVLSQQLKV